MTRAALHLLFLLRRLIRIEDVLDLMLPSIRAVLVMIAMSVVGARLQGRRARHMADLACVVIGAFAELTHVRSAMLVCSAMSRCACREHYYNSYYEYDYYYYYH